MSLSLVFKALADPTRRQILGRLKAGPLSAGEIADGCDMSKPSVSHHLTLLKSAGLVDCAKHGQFLIYSLNLSVFEEVASAMLELFGPQESSSAPATKGAVREA